VFEVAAIASGGADRTAAGASERSGIAAADGPSVAELLGVSGAPEPRTPEAGIDEVAETDGASNIGPVAPGATCAATFPVASVLIPGRGRGSGIAPNGGAAEASPARRPTVANTRMNRMAVTGKDLSAAG
jgi:hypothetical protein